MGNKMAGFTIFIFFYNLYIYFTLLIINNRFLLPRQCYYSTSEAFKYLSQTNVLLFRFSFLFPPKIFRVKSLIYSRPFFWLLLFISLPFVRFQQSSHLTNLVIWLFNGSLFSTIHFKIHNISFIFPFSRLCFSTTEWIT